MDTLAKLVRRGLQEPDLIFYGLGALLNGYLHKIWFKLSGKRVRIGKFFRVVGRFYVTGSGTVVIGDNCMINSKLIKTTCFMPVYRDSIIKIGDNVTFSGTSIQCYDRVTIKDKCAIANAYIVDSPAHHLSVDRKDRDDRELPHAPVTVEQGAWISVNTVVTHGVTIGEFSVIGACALVRKDVKPRSLYAGVPAEFIRELSTTEDSNKSEDLHGVSCSNVPTVS